MQRARVWTQGGAEEEGGIPGTGNQHEAWHFSIEEEQADSGSK
jgi:hypothetical protein